MKNNFTYETIISLVLLVLAVLLLNPFGFWMPDMMLMSILALVVVVFAIFATFLMKERAFDEREASHRMLAGRVAFLSGSLVITLGIIFQSLKHEVDPSLVITLFVIILSKFIARIYSQNKF